MNETMAANKGPSELRAASCAAEFETAYKAGASEAPLTLNHVAFQLHD